MIAIGKIKDDIYTIGKSMVNCSNDCETICNDPANGVLPRCLFFDMRNKDVRNGCVIVGINPGKSAQHSYERNFYLERGNTYDSQLELWFTGKKAKYYQFLEDFTTVAGWHGPILWTELVKCECSFDAITPSLQTSRICTKKYLSDELKKIPKEWPLLAIGRETHKALAYLYPERSVLGVPHPTSSRGQFANLFSDTKRKVFTDDVEKQLNKFKVSTGIEHWLFQPKQ